MKLAIRVVAITLVAVAALAGNSLAKTSTVASNLHPSSVPGGGGPMPTCNPFSSNCSTIR